jgi:uncharacterized LabA/DUF88 family protein
MSNLNVGLFVDVGNLYYCIGKKFPSRKLDYGAYMAHAQGEGYVYTAKAYGSQMAEEAVGFITCLTKLGYTPHYVSLDEKKRRVHFDSQITVDVIKSLDKLDVVVIGSANPDLVPLVEYCKNKGRKVYILAAGINKDLRKAATKAIEIEESLLESIRG